MVQGRAVIGGFIPHDDRFGGRLTPWPERPGEFRYEDLDQRAAQPPAPGERARFSYGCPRGTGHCGSIVIGVGEKPAGPKTWAWNGNVERPTLKPSINCLSHGPKGEKYAGCGWHGWVTDGKFTNA